ncbi:MAG TPA: class I SAM-dependent methyltransferase [Terriglobales bacterium]|jgi:cyclopropane fatty-acyl-phospholipid synthase-like methyltransferase|nr:class I SAM-dependent methyltransferase [Terriglobales bacterium]
MRRFVPACKVSLLLFAALMLVFVGAALTASRFGILTILAAQNSANTNSQPEPRKTSQPYTGDLSIFENKDRDEKLQVQRVMDILGIKEGVHVADIGAGSGWFTVRAAKCVGNTGMVYAVDINPESIAYINRRIQQNSIGNIHAILSKEDDPTLPKNSIDAVLLLKTYHEIAHPVLLLENLRNALRSGARVGVIDRNGKGDDHGVSRDVVIQEAVHAGYQLQEQYDFVKGDGQDYFLVFRLNAAPK